MRIEIIGAGAVGLLVASYFAELKMDVRIVGKPGEKIEHSDLQITRTNTDHSISSIQMKKIPAVTKEADLIIVAVKYGQLHEVYASIEHVAYSIPVIFLQNGLAHYEEALALNLQHIAFCSVQFGAQKLSSYHVAHKGYGVMKVAVAKGNCEKFRFLKNLTSEQLPIVSEKDAERMLMEKALLNCLINPLTAILQIQNGQLITNNDAFRLLKDLYKELIDTFPQYEDFVQFEHVVTLCENTAKNTSSMLADRLANRKTEIDTIAGAILKKAERNQKRLPILQTLYLLVKAFEESGDKI